MAPTMSLASLQVIRQRRWKQIHVHGKNMKTEKQSGQKQIIHVQGTVQEIQEFQMLHSQFHVHILRISDAKYQ